MIHFYNVSKRYENGHIALANVSFRMNQGEMAFITGHSGAGKSTLLKLIAMIEKPTQGQIVVNEKSLSKLNAWQIPYYRRSMGLIFQDPHLIPESTIYENIALPLIIAGLPKKETHKRICIALDKVGMLNKERLYPEELSAGEKQRISIARAIINKPPVILADEPTGNLDPELTHEIFKLFEEFNRAGVTILIATHNLTQIANLHHRILVLRQGHLINGDVIDHYQEIVT